MATYAPELEIQTTATTVTSPPSPRKSIRICELSLLVAIAFGGSLVGSLMILVGSPLNTGTYSDTATILYAVIKEATALGLLAYLLFRQGRSWQDIGVSWRDWDTLHSLGLMVGSTFVGIVVWIIVQKSAYSVSGHWLASTNVTQMLGFKLSWLTFVFILINPFF
jgi:hypothetical protein